MFTSAKFGILCWLIWSRLRRCCFSPASLMGVRSPKSCCDVRSSKEEPLQLHAVGKEKPHIKEECHVTQPSPISCSVTTVVINRLLTAAVRHLESRRSSLPPCGSGFFWLFFSFQAFPHPHLWGSRVEAVLASPPRCCEPGKRSCQ